MSEELTTLQLAERIADAAIGTALSCWRIGQPLGNEPAAAVLRTLRETSHWFCRVTQDESGVIDGEAPKVRLPEVECCTCRIVVRDSFGMNCPIHGQPEMKL